MEHEIALGEYYAMIVVVPFVLGKELPGFTSSKRLDKSLPAGHRMRGDVE